MPVCFDRAAPLAGSCASVSNGMLEALESRGTPDVRCCMRHASVFAQEDHRMLAWVAPARHSIVMEKPPGAWQDADKGSRHRFILGRSRIIGREGLLCDAVFRWPQASPSRHSLCRQLRPS